MTTQVSPRHLSPKTSNTVFVTTIWMKQIVCNMIRWRRVWLFGIQDSFFVHLNDKYLVTKQMFDLICNIYFLPLTETNLQVLNLSNKIVDFIIGGLEKESDVRINMPEKIKLYNQTSKMLNNQLGIGFNYWPMKMPTWKRWNSSTMLWLICFRT